MAARKTPSAGGKPDKILRDALLLELNREDNSDGKRIKRFRRIAAKLVDSGVDGKLDAIREIFDRVEGRAAQAVQLSGEDGGPIQVTWSGK